MQIIQEALSLISHRENNANNNAATVEPNLAAAEVGPKPKARKKSQPKQENVNDALTAVKKGEAAIKARGLSIFTDFDTLAHAGHHKEALQVLKVIVDDATKIEELIPLITSNRGSLVHCITEGKLKPNFKITDNNFTIRNLLFSIAQKSGSRTNKYFQISFNQKVGWNFKKEAAAVQSKTT